MPIEFRQLIGVKKMGLSEITWKVAGKWWAVPLRKAVTTQHPQTAAMLWARECQVFRYFNGSQIFEFN